MLFITGWAVRVLILLVVAAVAAFGAAPRALAQTSTRPDPPYYQYFSTCLWSDALDYSATICAELLKEDGIQNTNTG